MHQELCITDLEELEKRAQGELLDEFDILCHDVVPFRAVARELVCLISLEDVGTCPCEVHYYLELACVSSEMQGRPLLDSAGDVEVERIHALVR